MENKIKLDKLHLEALKNKLQSVCSCEDEVIAERYFNSNANKYEYNIRCATCKKILLAGGNVIEFEHFVYKFNGRITKKFND